MNDTILICDLCGEEAHRVAPDFVDYCDDCGIVEANTHEEIIEDDLQPEGDFSGASEDPDWGGR